MASLVLSSFLCTALLAPGDKPQRVYLSNVLEPTTKGKAAFYVEPAGKEDTLYLGRMFTTDGVLKAEGHYADAALHTPHGHFKYYWPDGKVESEGDYAKGLKSGVWLRFNNWGEPLAEKVYNPDALNNIIYTQAPTMPKFQGGEQALNKYIKEKVGKVHGAVASFTVEKDGKLSDVKVTGVDPERAEQLADVLKNAPTFSSGQKDGSPTRVRLAVPLK